MSLLSNLLRKQPSPPPVPSIPSQQIVPTGQLLSNRYLISETLGRGAMGEVYLAEDTVLGGVSVAVKVMSQALPTQDALDKFSREAQIGAFLGHHNVNIVRVLDFGIHDERIPFYVMEYVYGITLAAEIERTPLPVKRAIRLMSQVCAGLQSAHQGVVIDKKLYSVLHRDLKPANIFLTNNSSFGEMAKILDFGISEFFSPTHKSTEAEAMGTLAYSSAQQLSGQKLGPDSDIYSLGITLFESITGSLPIQPSVNTVHEWIEAHQKQPPQRLRQAAPHLQVPESLDQLIQKCLAKKNKDRPQSIQEVLDRLKQISDSLGVNFPTSMSSHEEALNEIFGETDAPKPMSDELPPQQTQVLDPSNPATLKIQSVNLPVHQTQRISHKPQAIAQKLAWPQTKPISEIVFAQMIQTPDIEQAALWTMLNHAEPQWNALPCHHIEFMVELQPYPMLAWVTVLHDRDGQMRCLPCFIDLGDQQRRQLIQNLIQQGEYLFLLFDQAKLQHPVQVATFKINGHQKQLLHQTWMKTCNTIQKTGNPSGAKASALAASKQKLKARYKRLKAQLPEKLSQKASSP